MKSHVLFNKNSPLVLSRGMMHAVAIFAVAIMTTLLAVDNAQAADMLKAGAVTVNENFGNGSTFSKWLILGEVIFGVVSYIKTKNLLLLAGVIVVVVFTTVGFGLAV